MTISVIIPTLNEAQTVRATLSRLQAFPLHEIVVVDGESHDETLEAVSAVTPAARMMSVPAGRARQMNAGAAVTTGEVLLFLHADTLLPSTAVDDIQNALADPRVVGGRFDARLDRDKGLFWLICRMMSWRSRLSRIATGDQAIFVRREIFEAIGGFPDLPIMEDIAFSKRLKQAGRLAALRSCIVTSSRRWERQGTARTILLMWGLRLLFFIGVSPHRLRRLYADIR